MNQPHVVIIGGGFAGLTCARRLARSPVRVSLVDRRNHHLFQPLLYQVATAALSPADIAAPIRKVLRGQKNAASVLGEVVGVDTERRVVRLDSGNELSYDTLVVATGVTHAYYGHDEWSERAPGLKSIEEALTIRRRFLLAFERAELETDPGARERELTFVVVGAGPTGVELAGTMAEISRTVLRRDFRSIDPARTRVVLVEANDRVLHGFPPGCSDLAHRQLHTLGVEIRLETKATSIEDGRVELTTDDGVETLEAGNVLWAAGVRASPLGESLGECDRSGRVRVREDLSVPGRQEVFVLGDLARVEQPDGGPVPGMAPGAIQMGRHAARIIDREARARRSGRDAPPRDAFRFRDKGMLATIGRNRAVAHVLGRSWGGLSAWLLWALVHIFFLIGFRNRVMVMLEWIWMYVFYERGARLITGERKERG